MSCQDSSSNDDMLTLHLIGKRLKWLCNWDVTTTETGSIKLIGYYRDCYHIEHELTVYAPSLDQAISAIWAHKVKIDKSFLDAFHA